MVIPHGRQQVIILLLVSCCKEIQIITIRSLFLINTVQVLLDIHLVALVRNSLVPTAEELVRVLIALTGCCDNDICYLTVVHTLANLGPVLSGQSASLLGKVNRIVYHTNQVLAFLLLYIVCSMLSD